MTRQIALLRAVNVGGHRKVPMQRLRELMKELGYRDVATYVQSGNVVYTGVEEAPDAAAALLVEQLSAAFGFEIPVLVRTRDQLGEIVRANPLADVATEPARLHVLFLSDAPERARLEAIDPAPYAPETYVARGRELYLWTPDGIGRSALAQALGDRRLGVTSTARNWRTVEKLLAMAGDA